MPIIYPAPPGNRPSRWWRRRPGTAAFLEFLLLVVISVLTSVVLWRGCR